MIHLILKILGMTPLVSRFYNYQLFFNIFYRHYILLYPFTKSEVFNTDILANTYTLHIIGESYYKIIIVYFYRSADRVNNSKFYDKILQSYSL